MTIPEYLRKGPFRDLLIGQGVSAFGDWMATVALMALVLEISGSPAAVGGVLALRLMPSIVAGPLATTAALKWDRKKTMLTMDLIRAGLVVLIPFVDALWWVYLWAFLTEVANLVFLPARDAAIPDLVDEDVLPTANGLVLVSSYGNIPLGAAAFAGLTNMPDVFGGLLQDNPFAVVFFVDSLTYLVSFYFISRIELPGTADESDIADDEAEMSGFKAFFRAFRFPLIRAILPGLITVMLGIGALFSLGIVYVREVLGASDMAFGGLIAIFGIGAAGSVWWVQRQSGRTLLTVVRGAVIAMGAMLATMSLMSDLLWSYVVAIPFGAAAAAALVGALTFLQEELGGRQRVVGFAAFHMMFRFGLSIAAIGAGAIVGLVPSLSVPLLGELAPTAIVMFGAGVLVVLGGVAIRSDPISEASERTSA